MATRVDTVRRYLNEATDQIRPGNPRHEGRERFWNLPLKDFLDTEMRVGRVRVKVIQVERPPEDSPLIMALRAEKPPFREGNTPGPMPRGRPRMPKDRIDYIAKWIGDGCPDD